MATQEEAKVKAAELCWLAIREASMVALDEGGISGVLQLAAILTHGEIIPGEVAARLEEEAAKICSA